MPYVFVDTADVVDEIPDDALVAEIKRRIKTGRIKQVLSEDSDESWTRYGLAEDIRTAFYARNSSRLEALLVVLETREAQAE